MAVIAGDVFQVTFKGSIFEQIIMLTHHLAVAQNDNNLTEQACSDLILAAVKSGGSDDIEGPYAMCLNTSYICEEIWCQKIWPDRFRKRQTAGTEPGQAGAAEVSNLHAAITLQTDFSGRDQQATKQIGPIFTGTTHISDGKLTPAYVSLLEDLGNALIEDLALDTAGFLLDPCVFHGFGATPRFNIVTSFKVHPEIRNSYRRVVGRGI